MNTSSKLTLDDVKQVIQSQIDVFEMDFTSEEFGVRARLLHKHYKSFLGLLNHL